MDIFGFLPENLVSDRFLVKMIKMITKQSDIIDKTFGYLLRGEI